MSEPMQYRLIVFAAVLGLILNACTALPGTPAVTPPAPTVPPATVPPTATVPAPDPTAVPVPPVDPSLAWQRIEVSELGVAFDAPAGWLRFDPDWLWAPDENSKLRLGFSSREVPAGTEVEALMLPSPAQMLDARPLELAAGQAMSYTLEVYAPGESGGEPMAVETHVIVRDAQRRAYDIYVRAGTLDELAGVDVLLWHVLESWTLP